MFQGTIIFEYKVFPISQKKTFKFYTIEFLNFIENKKSLHQLGKTLQYKKRMSKYASNSKMQQSSDDIEFKNLSSLNNFNSNNNNDEAN